ncbi:hypothetical protein L3X38_045367 [Prunus dulcis]|uniref:Uncharacterized protein n=1 Tax=Prunus dulcis TaxID=3755 RepID=A0AAD4YNZ0_PRUDU|nr:hypothetical protein L3X38_045367 [Prunus dulcis]
MSSDLSGYFKSVLMKVGLGSSSVPKFISCRGSSTSGGESSNAAGAKSNTSSCKTSSSCSSVRSWGEFCHIGGWILYEKLPFFPIYQQSFCDGSDCCSSILIQLIGTNHPSSERYIYFTLREAFEWAELQLLQFEGGRIGCSRGFDGLGIALRAFVLLEQDSSWVRRGLHVCENQICNERSRF